MAPSSRAPQLPCAWPQRRHHRTPASVAARPGSPSCARAGSAAAAAHRAPGRPQPLRARGVAIAARAGRCRRTSANSSSTAPSSRVPRRRRHVLLSCRARGLSAAATAQRPQSPRTPGRCRAPARAQLQCAQALRRRRRRRTCRRHC
ncbi:hypothetical protein E2562_014460 [Oryza meyeriana var. granulata]|uniref:Uncharacterized protein n=1 Tax=Oryza meyeriana var. granulata TaxID=110450 RepID=A0A6G1CQ76_9ORYZ|nr:hypothetical protein E2562_014460 [Oryza meyeriana var. granulata]